MSTLNTQDKIIISRNFSTFNLLTESQRNQIKEAQGFVSLDDMDSQIMEDSTESIIANFAEKSGQDPELCAQSFEALSNLRQQGGFEGVNPVHLRIMADMIEEGI